MYVQKYQRHVPILNKQCIVFIFFNCLNCDSLTVVQIVHDLKNLFLYLATVQVHLYCSLSSAAVRNVLSPKKKKIKIGLLYFGADSLPVQVTFCKHVLTCTAVYGLNLDIYTVYLYTVCTECIIFTSHTHLQLHSRFTVSYIYVVMCFLWK